LLKFGFNSPKMAKAADITMAECRQLEKKDRGLVAVARL
jgi:hypothetical protein